MNVFDKIDWEELKKRMELDHEYIEGTTQGGNPTVRSIHYDVPEDPITGELQRGPKTRETYQIYKRNGEVLRLTSDYVEGIERLDWLPYKDADYSDMTRSYERKIGGSKLWECTKYVDDNITYNRHNNTLALKGNGIFDIAKLPRTVRPAVAKAVIEKIPFLEKCSEIMKYASKLRI